MLHLSLSFGSVLVRVELAAALFASTGSLSCWRPLYKLRYWRSCALWHLGTWSSCMFINVCDVYVCLLTFLVLCGWEGDLNVLNPREISACFPFFVRRCRAPAAQWKLMLLCCLFCFSKCLNLQEALSKNPETELGWGRLFFESAAAL